ncbi:MAG: sugar transferase [Proteobacteria bacterium]|nr:sugar transferase [Pseudomonadota bacterium]MBS0573269.1 sugar transferase [Pseudomonadota bacterium]
MTVPYADFSDVTPVYVPTGFYSNIGKRLLDIALVVISLPVVVPLLVLILGITALDGGKPLYVQRRIGRGGREFLCWKVRTMVHDADRVLDDLMRRDPEVAHEWRERQKLSCDPRITAFGRLLRRTSLDELPQLWNVLNGTMSLVGPRPFTPDQRQIYAGGRDSAAYYALRPGLSGLWQISRRNAGSFAERVRYDEEYGRHLTLAFDLWILFSTVSVVLSATGI